jgi:hypothetical protein
MAEYFSPTVVQPNIPVSDMTPLERLILSQVFEQDTVENDRIYYYASSQPEDLLTICVGDLRAAWVASRDHADSCIGKQIEMELTRYDAEPEPHDCHDDIDIDMTAFYPGFEGIFQDIVRRSTTINDIVVTTSFNCAKMLPDAFGGAVMLITANEIQWQSTNDVLQSFYDNLSAKDTSKQSPQPRRNTCTTCNGQTYLVRERDDGRQAIERCDACAAGVLSDEQAAILARHDGIQCSERYPCVISAKQDEPA